MKLPIHGKKKYVINLRIRGYTIRQIAEALHMSTRDVEKILKEHEREEKESRKREVIEREEKENKKIFSSKRSEALQLYKKGKIPLDVAITLEITTDEAKTFYHEYCSLQYPPQLTQIFTELNNANSFNQLIDLYHLIIDKGLSIEEAIKAIETIKKISLLEEKYQDLSEKVAEIVKIQDSLINDTSFFRDQNEEMKKRLNYKLDKIEIAEKIIKQKEEAINNINSGKDYHKAHYRIKQHVENLFGNKKNVLQLAVLSLFNAVKESHKSESPLKDFSKSVYEYVSDSSDTEVYREKLQHVAEKIWDSMSDICTHNILNPSSNSELKR
jgi:hypothetical protein